MLVPPHTIQAPNGLVITPDGRRMFVSDYAGFIFRIDLASGAVTRLPQPKNATSHMQAASTRIAGARRALAPFPN